MPPDPPTTRCANCPRPALPGQCRCAPCAARNRLQCARLYARRKRAGVCPDCGTAVPPDVTRCEACQRANTATVRASWARRKARAAEEPTP
jgi:hypothetical protein